MQKKKKIESKLCHPILFPSFLIATANVQEQMWRLNLPCLEGITTIYGMVMLTKLTKVHST